MQNRAALTAINAQTITSQAEVSSGVFDLRMGQVYAVEILPNIAAGGTQDMRIEYRQSTSPDAAGMPGYGDFPDIAASTAVASGYTNGTTKFLAGNFGMTGPYIQIRATGNAGNSAHANPITVRLLFIEDIT